MSVDPFVVTVADKWCKTIAFSGSKILL